MLISISQNRIIQLITIIGSDNNVISVAYKIQFIHVFSHCSVLCALPVAKELCPECSGSPAQSPLVAVMPGLQQQECI